MSFESITIFSIESSDERNRLNIGGRIQPRFEYQRRENDDNFSRFRFRRLRVDFRGHVIDEDLTFRIMPELRDNARCPSPARPILRPRERVCPAR
jgi:hypothetical protein